jgi:hypothetical protein
MKTNELTGAALDWAVAKCESVPLVLAPFTGARNFVIRGQNMKPTIVMYEPSIYWAQGGPIIEREGIAILQCPRGWAARIGFGGEYIEGPTPLIAAMRCYVANKLGDDVEIPEVAT